MVKCTRCKTENAVIKRPKNGATLCKECFFFTFEAEVHHTITTNNLFSPGDKVAIGASGGKDSTVLAYVMKLLNERHNYGLELFLLSIDEGITGERKLSLLFVFSYENIIWNTVDLIASILIILINSCFIETWLFNLSVVPFNQNLNDQIAKCFCRNFTLLEYSLAFCKKKHLGPQSYMYHIVFCW